MMRYAPAVCLGMLLSGHAHAQILKDFTPDQMVFLGRLGNAYGTARHCNYAIDPIAIRKSGENIFGESPAPARQGLDIAFVVDGFSAASDDLIFADRSPRALRTTCAKMLKLYGPGGSVIDGAVKP